MHQEENKCSFCREVKVVNRKYIHPKNDRNLEDKGKLPWNEFVIIFYCQDCGIED